MGLDGNTSDTGMPAAPAGSGGAPAPAMPGPLARLGRNEQLVLAGAAAVVIADVIGVFTQDWGLDIAYALLMLGSIAAAVLVYLGADRMVAGLPGRTLIRIAGAIVGAYGLIDFGDLLSSLGDWEPLDLVLTVVEVVGAAVLAYGCWAVSGGRLLSDIGGAVRTAGSVLADRLVHFGAIGVVAGWFILMAVADVFRFTTDAQLVVLAGTLILLIEWLARNPGAGSNPVPAPWGVVSLAAVAVVLGLYWFVRVIGDTLEFGDLTTYIPMVIYLAALAALGLGAFLRLPLRSTPAA
jgi:hypothetical protein